MKIKQPVIHMNMNNKYALIRLRDGLVKESEDIIWVEFNDDGTFKEKHKEIKVGLSLLMSPFNQYFTWQTTEVTEIIDQREDYIRFRTINNTYELFKSL